MELLKFLSIRGYHTIEWILYFTILFKVLGIFSLNFSPPSDGV